MLKAALVIPLLLMCVTANAADGGREVVAEYVKRVNAGDWARAFELMDPAEVRDMRSVLAKQIDSKPGTQEKIFKGLSQEEVDKLSDSQYVGSAIANSYRPLAQTLDASAPKYALIGFVEESANTLHAVMRVAVDLPGETNVQMQVFSVHKRGSTWVLSSGRQTLKRPETAPPKSPPYPNPPAPPVRKQ